MFRSSGGYGSNFVTRNVLAKLFLNSYYPKEWSTDEEPMKYRVQFWNIYCFHPKGRISLDSWILWVIWKGVIWFSSCGISRSIMELNLHAGEWHFFTQTFESFLVLHLLLKLHNVPRGLEIILINDAAVSRNIVYSTVHNFYNIFDSVGCL